MSCWDLGGIGTHAGAICPDPARIPAEYAVVRLLTSSPTLLEKRRAAGPDLSNLPYFSRPAEIVSGREAVKLPPPTTPVSGREAAKKETFFILPL